MHKERYRHYWHNMVLNMVKRYPKKLAEEDSIVSWTFYHAIERAVAELHSAHPEDFDERLRALNMMYFNGNESYETTAMTLHVSRRTLERWAGEFIERVGKNAGFK